MARFASQITDLDLRGLSQRNLAILARGVRGGDGSTETEAPSLEDLLSQVEGADALDDDALAALIDDIRAQILALVQTDGGVSAEALAQAQDAETKLKGLVEVATTRAEDAAARAVEAQRIVAELTAADGGDGEDTEAEGNAETATEGEEDAADEGDGETEAPEAATEAEVVELPTTTTEEAPAEAPAPERVAASAPSRQSVVTRVEPRRPDLRPRARQIAPAYALRASANVQGLTAGESLDSEKLANAFDEVVRAGSDYRGPGGRVPVASIGEFDASKLWGEERFLDYNDRANERKIAALVGPKALRASGGACAPVPQDYTQPIIGTDARPVRDALARFAADRGGVSLIPPPTLSSASGAVGTWTSANDTTPSNPSTKPVLTMACAETVATSVDAITTTIKVGNYRSMYFRENVDAIAQKAAQWAARVAERKLLTTIGAGSVNVSVGQDLGTTRSVLAGLDRAAANIRQNHRMDPDAPLRFIGPAWLLDNIESDLAREAPGASTERLAIADSYIENFFTVRGITPTWALDGETGQEFSAQVDGALNGWPTTAVGYLFVEGTWLYLDGGMLNLGVVRDATLVGTNDFLMFSEFMENAAFHGEAGSSFRISFDICPDGTTSFPDTGFDPCTTNS